MRGIKKMKNEFLIKQRDLNYEGKVLNTPRQHEKKKSRNKNSKRRWRNKRARGMRWKEINVIKSKKLFIHQ